MIFNVMTSQTEERLQQFTIKADDEEMAAVVGQVTAEEFDFSDKPVASRNIKIIAVAKAPAGAVATHRQMSPSMKKPVAEAIKAHNFKSAEEFTGYLADTLIPDLEESGMEGTAADFEKLVWLINVSTYEEDFAQYLQQTLIPDLKEAGQDATAKDFEEGIYWMKKEAGLPVRESKKPVTEAKFSRIVLTRQGGKQEQIPIDKAKEAFKDHAQAWNGDVEQALEKGKDEDILKIVQLKYGKDITKVDKVPAAGAAPAPEAKPAPVTPAAGAAPAAGVKTEAKGEADAHAARELKLFIDNTKPLYVSQLRDFYVNLIRKIKAGRYDHELAIKLFEYLAERAAKLYAKEFGTGPQDSGMIFTPATRRLVATELRDEFERDIRFEEYNGNMFEYDPKLTPEEMAKVSEMFRDKYFPHGRQESKMDINKFCEAYDKKDREMLKELFVNADPEYLDLLIGESRKRKLGEAWALVPAIRVKGRYEDMRSYNLGAEDIGKWVVIQWDVTILGMGASGSEAIADAAKTMETSVEELEDAIKDIHDVSGDVTLEHVEGVPEHELFEHKCKDSKRSKRSESKLSRAIDRLIETPTVLNDISSEDEDLRFPNIDKRYLVNLKESKKK